MVPEYKPLDWRSQDSRAHSAIKMAMVVYSYVGGGNQQDGRVAGVCSVLCVLAVP